MLARFEVTNFKNFKDTITFDLTKSNSYEFNKECISNGIINKAIVYGYNGVGKSNLGFAIFDLVSHLTDRNNSSELYENYTYAGSSEHASFKYEFHFLEDRVVYEYGKTDLDTLVFENLYINGKLFAAIDRRKSNTAFIDAEGAEGLKKDLSETIISVVTYIKKNTVLEPNRDNDCFRNFVTYVSGMLFFRSLGQNNYIGLEQGTTGIETDIIEKNNVEAFENFLNKAGIKCHLITVINDGKKPHLAFEFDGKQIPFYDIASQGTRALGVFYFWFQRLKKEDTKVTLVFIDEFDAFYHYSLSLLVIEQLRGIKPQVIVTTHNTSVMTNELLRPDCYFFIDEKGIRSLSNRTPKELREAHNIEKMYRAGAFDG